MNILLLRMEGESQYLQEIGNQWIEMPLSEKMKQYFKEISFELEADLRTGVGEF